jgi:hypothetical protein
MATNVDKALYQQPVGIDALGENESPLEIEIVDPEEVNIGIDGLEISLKPGEDDGEEGFDDNLAEYMVTVPCRQWPGIWPPILTMTRLRARTGRKPTSRA